MSIQKSLLYKPYLRCVKLVAGTAQKPTGPLARDRIIGRNILIDTIQDSPECQKILKGESMPEMKKCCPQPKPRSRWKDVRKITVLGAVMVDLGYSRYSEKAWSREPI